MDQVKNLPCGKIVLSQAYDHIYETIAPGASWFQYGFHKCITTSEAQKTYITNNMKNVSVDVIKPVISDVFVEPTLPPKTMIAMVAREQREGLNIIKEFYNKYPQYRFFTFKDLRGLSQEEFANSMKDCFMSVWIDPTSSFGTFPIESMMMGIPVVGKIPHMVPEWMKEENGVWIENPLQFTDVIADMVQTWLEDNLKPELYTNGKETASEYTNMDNFKNEVVTLFSDFINKRKEAFEAQISE
jgi:glycosyltransferase involved in cell wall biosynthesis